MSPLFFKQPFSCWSYIYIYYIYMYIYIEEYVQYNQFCQEYFWSLSNSLHNALLVFFDTSRTDSRYLISFLIFNFCFLVWWLYFVMFAFLPINFRIFLYGSFHWLNNFSSLWELQLLELALRFLSKLKMK